MTAPSPAARLHVPARVGTRLIGRDLCLINQERREMWLFGRRAPQIWERLQRGGSTSEVAADLRAAEGGTEAAAVVERFVTILLERGLLRSDGQATQASEARAECTPRSASQREQVFVAAVRADRLGKTWIEVTGHCNFRCRHCYMDFGNADVLPLPDIDRITDELAAHGCPELVLSGGEIFLRRDARDVITCVQAKGFLTSVFSNAFLIDDKTVEFLAAQRLDCVQVSVYGATAATHEAVTRHAGSFERTIRAVRALTTAGVPVRLACHVQGVNFHEIERFPELAQSLGAEHSFDSTLVARRDGTDGTEPISVQQQVELYRRSFMTPPRADTYCSAAVAKGRISAAADLYPCELVHTVTMGNLKRATLNEIWASPRRLELRETIVNWKDERCSRCKSETECVPCAALRGFNEHTARRAQACILTAATRLAACTVPTDCTVAPDA